VGDRWYRIQNMLGGMLLQSFCLAAAALGLGCRPNLGYPVDDIDRLLRLPPDHTALVHLVIGHVERECGVYDASIGNKGDLDG